MLMGLNAMATSRSAAIAIVVVEEHHVRLITAGQEPMSSGSDRALYPRRLISSISAVNLGDVRQELHVQRLPRPPRTPAACRWTVIRRRGKWPG
jgi:hypothetical protein